MISIAYLKYMIPYLKMSEVCWNSKGKKNSKKYKLNMVSETYIFFSEYYF